MDLNKDARLTFDEFKEGSKLDPTIVQVCLGLFPVDDASSSRVYMYNWCMTESLGVVTVRRSRLSRLDPLTASTQPHLPRAIPYTLVQ